MNTRAEREQSSLLAQTRMERLCFEAMREGRPFTWVRFVVMSRKKGALIQCRAGAGGERGRDGVMLTNRTFANVNEADTRRLQEIAYLNEPYEGELDQADFERSIEDEQDGSDYE